MKTRLRKTITALGLALSLAACNMPQTNQPPAESMQTAAALTVEAALGGQTPLASPTAGSPPAASESTPTYSQPSASFKDVTNCRTGPGMDYEKVTQIPPGVSVEIIGFFPPGYWVVQTDAGPCWVPGEFITPAGSISAVPTITAPATPEGGIPAAPAFLKENGWAYFCKGDGTTDITLSWSDKADNETGYRVFRNGNLIAELPANSTYYSETINLVSGQSVGYQVQAYNASGAAVSGVAAMTCP